MNDKAKLYAAELGEEVLARQLRAAAPRCRFCHEPIRWTTTHRGKRLPVDYDQHEAGTVVVLGDRATVFPSQPHEVPKGSTLHFPHHATCRRVDDARASQPTAQPALF